MYNPYNWNITKIKSKTEEENCTTPKCILTELTEIFSLIDIAKLKNDELRREIAENDKAILDLEDRKLHLLNVIMTQP